MVVKASMFQYGEENVYLYLEIHSLTLLIPSHNNVLPVKFINNGKRRIVTETFQNSVHPSRRCCYYRHEDIKIENREKSADNQITAFVKPF